MLFTFPSRYWFAIGLRIPLSLVSLRLRDCHPLWSNFPDAFFSRFKYYGVVLLPRMCIATHAVWALPRSLATTGGIIIYFLFLGVLRCFSSPRLPLHPVMEITGLQPAGLSHSEIHGSMVICTYPRLIAAYHVLHRLREPRHPPDALTFFRHYSTIY